MAGNHNFAKMHIVADGDEIRIKKDVKAELSEHGISHTTVEIESPEEECIDRDCHIEHSVCENHHHHHHHHH